jgi:lysyl-tRNA synthetase class 2
MKRLLAAGAPAIFQVAKVFRSAERGALHNPEFTMVEWYRPGDDMSAGMQLLSDLCEALLTRGPAERISYAEAFQRGGQAAPLSPGDSSAPLSPCGRGAGGEGSSIDPHTASATQLAEHARTLGIIPPESFATADRDAWLDLLLVERVQPQLGRPRPSIVYDYPASQAALARVREENPPVAERFELYVDGIELANGYHELLDPNVLRERNRHNNALRAADGKPQLPEESRLLAAMQSGLPPCTGVALGFDRLVMLAAGAGAIDEVVAFPIERA